MITSLDLSQEIDNLIVQSLLQAVDYIRLSSGYENEKKLCFHQLINKSINRTFKNCQFKRRY